MSVAFATKCWEKDYIRMASGGFKRKVDSCKYDFDDKLLVVNNVKKLEAVTALLQKSQCTPFIVPVTNLAATTVLAHYNLTEDDFKGGYYYSIAELVAINAVDTDYLCYVQGDCIMSPSSDWVTEGIQLLEDNPNLSVISPLSEVNTWHGEHDLDQFFSDQAFLIRVKEFREPTVFSGGEDIPEYPPHGGDSFEKKVAQYLRREGKWRRILKEHYYVHPAY